MNKVMTDRERRVLAAMDAVGWRGAPPTVYRTVEVMLDAADRAVPMVPRVEVESCGTDNELDEEGGIYD